MTAIMPRSTIVEAGIYLRLPSHPAFQKYRESFVSAANRLTALSEADIAEIADTANLTVAEVISALIKQKRDHA